MFVHAELDAVVLDLQAVRIVSAESFIGLVRRVKIPDLLTGDGIRHSADHSGRYDDPLFTEPELAHEAVENDVNRMQRLQGVTVDRDAQRAVIVDIVCDRRPVVAEQGFLDLHSRLFVQIRIYLSQRVSKSENVLRFANAAFLHLRPVKLILYNVGRPVPFVPLKARVVVTALRDPGDKNAFLDLSIVPCNRDELIRHSITDPDLPGIRDHVSIAVVLFLVPDLQRSAAESRSLLDAFGHLYAEVIILKRFSHESLQRIVAAVVSVNRHIDIALVRPDHAGDLRAYGLREA